MWSTFAAVFDADVNSSMFKRHVTDRQLVNSFVWIVSHHVVANEIVIQLTIYGDFVDARVLKMSPKYTRRGRRRLAAKDGFFVDVRLDVFNR